MEIKIICTNPDCQQHIALDASLRGTSQKCHACGATFRVPSGAASAPPQSVPWINTKAVLWSIVGLIVIGAISGIVLWKYHRDAKELASRQEEMQAARQAAVLANGPVVQTNRPPD